MITITITITLLLKFVITITITITIMITSDYEYDYNHILHVISINSVLDLVLMLIFAVIKASRIDYHKTHY